MNRLLNEPLGVLCIGIKELFIALQDQEVDVYYLTWHPPQKAKRESSLFVDKKVEDILKKIL